MKKLAVVAMALLVSVSVMYAQDMTNVTAMDKTRFGVGVSFGKEPFFEADFPMSLLDYPTFYTPIQFSPSFRLEPEFGYVRIHEEENSDEHTYTIMLFGAGLFYTKWYGKCDLYFGGRFQMIKWSSNYEWDGQESSSSRTDTVFGPAIGGECWCCNHVSFGGELQFNYYNVGDWEYDNGNANGDEEDVSIMKFKGLFFIRWWF